jgi:hypothetical protein
MNLCNHSGNQLSHPIHRSISHSLQQTCLESRLQITLNAHSVSDTKHVTDMPAVSIHPPKYFDKFAIIQVLIVTRHKQWYNQYLISN